MGFDRDESGDERQDEDHASRALDKKIEPFTQKNADHVKLFISLAGTYHQPYEIILKCREQGIELKNPYISKLTEKYRVQILAVQEEFNKKIGVVAITSKAYRLRICQKLIDDLMQPIGVDDNEGGVDLWVAEQTKFGVKYVGKHIAILQVLDRVSKIVDVDEGLSGKPGEKNPSDLPVEEVQNFIHTGNHEDDSWKDRLEASKTAAYQEVKTRRAGQGDNAESGSRPCSNGASSNGKSSKNGKD